MTHLHAAPGARGAEGEPHGGHAHLVRGDDGVDGVAHRIVAVLLEQLVEFLDAARGEAWLAMGDLGEQRERASAEVEQLLTLLIELGAPSVHRGDLGSAMLG